MTLLSLCNAVHPAEISELPKESRKINRQFKMSASFPESSNVPNHLLQSRCKLGEGPVWDHRTGQLCFIDIHAETFYRITPGTQDMEQFDVKQKIGCSALRAEGGYVLGLTDGLWIFEPENGRLEKWVAPENLPESNRFNDGKVDPAGRFWAGTMSLKGEKEAGTLYCVFPDGRIEEKVTGVTISNGLAWSSDRTKFYYIDTPTGKVDVFDYDDDTGEIANRRTAVTIPEGHGHPDGMCIDDEDTLWIALWGGSGVLHCDPATGNVIDKLPVPTEKVTCTTFGGPEMTDLFITTAGGPGHGEPESEDADNDPEAGNTFTARLPVSGPQATLFGGNS